jgi:ribosome-binding protein aMBF1 (putative translation factor)
MLLDWSQAELAAAAGVRVLLLRRFETGVTDPRGLNRDKIERALTAAGIEFLEDGAGAVGVWLRRPVNGD